LISDYFLMLIVVTTRL